MSESSLPSARDSVTGRAWRLRAPDADRAAWAIAQRLNLPEIVGRVLVGRGVGLDDAAAHMAPTLRDLTPDPSILAGMDAAAERLADAVIRRESAALFADYDADGAACAALMTRWFQAFGLKTTTYIPDRLKEGYGPNTPAMARLAESHRLILTLDCGTLGHDSIAAARALGADVIVLDHHLPGDAHPDALMVNPARADDLSGLEHLCAAGVTFMALIAANRALRRRGTAPADPPNLLKMLDLVALATVADVVPLKGLNRAFVRQGLAVMAQRGNTGLAALADAARLREPPTPYHVGYVLGPRLNAGGRVGDSMLAARLLSTDDPRKAAALADQLEICNESRRAIQAEVQDAALAQVAAREQQTGGLGPLVWAASDQWTPGVVGVVASRLKDAFNRPAFVIGIIDGEGRGSGRSTSGVDLGGAVQRCHAAGLLLKAGGHRMAAGLSVAQERIPEAMAFLSEDLARQDPSIGRPRDVLLDGALSVGGATQELCAALESAGPYGASAPAPQIWLPRVSVVVAKKVGDGHLQCVLTDASGARLEAICFRAFESRLGQALSRTRGAPLHVAGRLSLDKWGGRTRVKLQIEDAAHPS